MSLRLQCGVSSALLQAALALNAPAQAAPHVARLEITHDKPYVMVTVNGKGPFRFVIDTGTGAQAFVGPELADRLGLPVVGQARITDPSGKGERRDQLVRIDSLDIAGVEFSPVIAVRHSVTGQEGSCMGLLGFPLFRDYLLTLDYPGAKMTLATGELQPDGGRSVLPFRMPDGVPIVPLHIGGQGIEAQIDSGGTGLSLPEPMMSRIKLACQPTLFGNGWSLATEFQLKTAQLAEDVHLGRYTFARPTVEVNPAFPLANLGAVAIGNFAVTFDQKNLLMRLDAARQSFRLGVEPTRVRLVNAPQAAPTDIGLVPIG
jgi:hypothetical protein